MRFLLLPFAILYGLGVRLRHFLYDRGWLSSKRYPFPILCVGNLAVGGTGKTPMVEYLVRLLGQEQVAILSRGYRRKTRGFILADDSATAMTLGDEPYQYHRKFPRATVTVCESRQEGIERLLENPHFKYIILDDAFQHRKVQAGTNLLLTSYDKLYTQDFLLPVGSLRDIRSRARKAQIIIVTKCPELTQAEQEKIIQQLKPLPSQKVYFTSIAYSDRVYSHEDSQALKDFIATPFTLVTGIANPTPLVDFLEKQGASFEHLAYSDHHHFSNRELELLRQKGRILTTEKDYVRLEGALSTLYYLPIETQFLNDQRLIFND
ncbi:tetraacyldisaccharide 4'-kinase [Capnocytophaga gingivalis ATCC 33624]|jgi:tetraacyldisaccharide 4'-kinase|uniref:tetraacyldisaccharide 4'-kinase n=1 Tax=Capnocytophaga gingivalis TaxID=1017 RepID=UPI00019FBFC0|nr:tetraacyldisaccharide 4'-kinase [Capnocytophaga gingivalis]EEK14964.1 tetraacyldisaccharide 4'-kinase [Capnocytophaga gingivalis ATCC 33624]